MCGEENKLVQYFGGGENKGKEHLEGFSVERRAIFRFILKK